LVHQWLFLLSSKTVKTIGVPIVTGLPRLYQQCIDSVPIVKNSQETVKTAKMTIGVPVVTGLPRLYQLCINSVPIVIKVKNSEKTAKNSKSDHWYTNRYMSTKTVPTVYQSSKAVKNSQKTVKTAKMTIGVTIVTCLHTESAEYTKSASAVCVRRIHKACIATADESLTLWYFMCLHVCLCAAKVMRTSNSPTVVISADTRNTVKVVSTTATSRRQVNTI